VIDKKARDRHDGDVRTRRFRQQTFAEIPATRRRPGRALENAAFPLTVRTDESPPLANSAAPFGILEPKLPAGEKPLLPLTVRNVEPTLSGTLASVPPQRKSADAKSPIAGQIARIDADDDLAMLSWLQRLEDADKIDREFDEDKERWVVKRYGAAYSVFGARTPAPISVPSPTARAPSRSSASHCPGPASTSSSWRARSWRRRCSRRNGRTTFAAPRWSATLGCISSSGASRRWCG
jgi:hypothetical protein